jgi:uncharacterized membrane-anchored protein
MLDQPFKTAPAIVPEMSELTTLPGGSIWKLALRREALVAIAFVAVQIAILVLMIVLDGLPLLLGQRLMLKVVPVDPRDLFRGDYVVLDYRFGSQGVDFAGHAPRHGVGHEVYVPLVQEGDHYVGDRIRLAPPASGPYIRGTLDPSGRVNCGIEAYYVEEGEGLRLEQVIRSGSLRAEVAVWRGQAKLVRLVE